MSVLKRTTAVALMFLHCSFMVNAACSLGVVSHVTRDEFGERERAFAMMREAGIVTVRTDIDLWRCIPKKAGDAWDFSRFDAVVKSAERYGIEILPILNNYPEWGKDDFSKHERGWTNFVRETVRHFKGRLPCYEICNEPNLQMFWNRPNPANYLAALKAAYRTLKAEDPAAKVVISGFAGVPLDFIERIYALGGKDFFDVMNVHPYTWPNPPKGMLDPMLANLKDLMAKYGDGEKPIWVTEMGWPTHKARLPEQNLFLAGLRVARPDLKRWRIGYVDGSGTASRGKAYADAMVELLPPGSSAGSYTPSEINALLDADELDAVVYPFDESFPLDTIKHVARFVKRGGVLADFGGCPMWTPVRNGVVVEKTPDGKFIRGLVREQLRISTIWPNAKNGLVANTRAFGTEAAKLAGLKPDPNGFSAFRFFDDTLLKKGDTYIPLTAVTGGDGREVAGACVYRFNSDLKGAVVVAGGGSDRGGTSEADQATYLKQSIEISESSGVSRFYAYEFRAPENDAYYSEDQFGIVHKDFSPKPAYELLRKRHVEKTNETLVAPSCCLRTGRER